MSYTLYRNVKALNIKREKATRQRRTQDIVDPTRKREDYFVTAAEFTDLPCDVTFSDFKEDIQVGQMFSLAVDDKWQVLALVNHTTGKQAALAYKTMKFSDIFGILFFIAIPGVLCYSIAQKAFSTVKYHDLGWVILGVGVLIVLAILRGVTKQFAESRTALQELQG